jgi:hypothetical protein
MLRCVHGKAWARKQNQLLHVKALPPWSRAICFMLATNHCLLWAVSSCVQYKTFMLTLPLERGRASREEGAESVGGHELR